MYFPSMLVCVVYCYYTIIFLIVYWVSFGRLTKTDLEFGLVLVDYFFSSSCMIGFVFKLDGVAPLITYPPRTRFTPLYEKN